MNEKLEPVRISLRQADGDFFPLFRFGDFEKCSLVLVPAAAAQGKADLRFFRHPEDGSEPRSIGALCFPNLPAEGSVELRLDAELDAAGMLSVAVNWEAGNRTETALFHLAGDDAATALRPRSLLPRTRRGRQLLGIFFVVLGLGLVLWAAIAFANWGVRETAEPPMSRAVPVPGVKKI